MWVSDPACPGISWTRRLRTHCARLHSKSCEGTNWVRQGCSHMAKFETDGRSPRRRHPSFGEFTMAWFFKRPDSLAVTRAVPVCEMMIRKEGRRRRVGGHVPGRRRAGGWTAQQMQVNSSPIHAHDPSFRAGVQDHMLPLTLCTLLRGSLALDTTHPSPPASTVTGRGRLR